MELGDVVEGLHIAQCPLGVFLQLLVIRTIAVQRSLPLVDAAAQLVRIDAQQEGPDELAV